MRHVAVAVTTLLLLFAGCSTTESLATGTDAGLTSALYVSPSGSDGNTGSLASPFATLARAQRAMQSSSIKTTYIRAGTYRMTRSLVLTAADSGETWQYYPPDGVGTALLDGGDTVRGGVISIRGGSNITIDGLKVQDFVDYGISVSGGPHMEFGSPTAPASGNTVRNCDVGFNTLTSWNTGGISFFDTTPNSTIKNNYVHDVTSAGISITSWFAADDSIGGSIIANNVVLRSVQRKSDGGAIYVGMHGGYQAPPNGIQVLNNFVRDYGGPGIGGPAGIYLDDNTNNVLVSGNIVGPATPGSGNASRPDYQPFEIHNGHDNHITGNIADLGSTGGAQIALYFQDRDSTHGMAGNTFTGNIIVANFTGDWHTFSGFAYAQYHGAASDYTIRDNHYFNYGGGPVLTHGSLASDSNPIIANPQISGSTYSIAAGSPVFSDPVKFRPIAGKWGPPGFVIPPRG